MDGRGKEVGRLAAVAAWAGAAFRAASAVLLVGAGVMSAVGLVGVTAWGAWRFVPAAGA